MLRLFSFTVVALLMFNELSTVVFAQSEWIQIGDHIDWPDSLKDAEPGSQPERPQDLSDPDAVIAFAGHVEEIESAAFEEQLTLPENAHSTQVSTYDWQLLPEGLMYHSYLAGEKEPRFASQWLTEKDRGRVWEAAVGGRWGLVRKGTYGAINPQGFQFDIEGGALVRIDPEQESDLEAADFRVGFLATWRNGPWRKKVGYYHISSHVGDEYQIANPTFVRANYVRDALIAGVTYDINQALQAYGEVAVALNANGGAEPGELQFGLQYAKREPTGFRGAPFAAINGHLRQEYDFGGSVNAEAGWQWRNETNRSFRFGVQHYNGPSMQWSFVDQHEALTGLAIWFDY